MKSLFSLLIIGLLLAGINHILDAKEAAPFTSTSTPPAFVVSKKGNTLKLFNFTGSQNGNKTLLQWMVNENEEVNRFEIEKSDDGENFKIAALIFGSEKSNTDNYMFYEKATANKISYRVKIVENSGAVSYSDIIIVNPEFSNNDNVAVLSK